MTEIIQHPVATEINLHRVNEQFSGPVTKLDPGDVIAIVPVSPTPPAPTTT